MPPAPVQRLAIAPRLRTISIRWAESPNAAGYIAWTWFETDPHRPTELRLGRTNQHVVVTTNRARLFAAIAATDANGTVCGDILCAHFPKYPDVCDHLLLTCEGGSPPFTIEVGTLSTASESTWQFLTVLEEREMKITDAVERVPTFYRASAEEETTLKLTRVYKPDSREQ